MEKYFVKSVGTLLADPIFTYPCNRCQPYDRPNQNKIEKIMKYYIYFMLL